ncbi:MAG: glycosyltransferase family 4 protein [Desulfurococcus sp.]|nr:glycosyltransferase family 4 protein [Desulfurococcus sp.]
MISQYGIFPIRIGGVEKFTYNILSRICQDKRFECILVIPKEERINQDILRASLRRYNILVLPVKTIPYRLFKLLPAYILYLISIPVWTIIIVKSLVKFKPHIIHIHNITDVAIAAMLVKLLMKLIGYSEIPLFITTAHGRDLVMWLIKRRTFTSLLNEVVQRLCSNILDYLVFTNPLTFIYAKKWNIAEKASIIPPCVAIDANVHKVKEIDRRDVLHKKSLIFLCVSRIDKEKNIDNLLFAFSKLIKYLRYESKTFTYTHPKNIKLIIAGSGPLLRDMKELALKLGLIENVIFWGNVSEQMLEFLYKTADCVVIPSAYEGFSMTLVEALAYGVPIIAYRYLPAVVMISQDFRRYIGIVIDSPTADELFKAMLEFIHKLDYFAKYSELRRKLVIESLNCDLISMKYINVYFKLLKNLKRSGA